MKRDPPQADIPSQCISMMVKIATTAGLQTELLHLHPHQILPRQNLAAWAHLIAYSHSLAHLSSSNLSLLPGFCSYGTSL